MKLQVSAEELTAYLDEVWPAIAGTFEITELDAGCAVVRVFSTDANLRPGGSISGPTMFAAADLAFWVATLAVVGTRRHIYTTSATVNFMRRPGPGAMVAEARILKLGRTLSVGDVLLRSEGSTEALAHIAITYTVPR